VADGRDWGKSLVRVRVYVEGGGDSGSTKAACREGFRRLFQNLGNLEQNPTIIASGGRLKAFHNFCDALERNADEVILLLVDAERPVGAGVWAHLSAKPDNWPKPGVARDEQAHLMVQSMEAWLIADKEKLAEYYGQGFRLKSLPPRRDIEAIRKNDLVPALERAAKDTKKGKYHKTAHGYDILGLISPAKVRQKSPHADRFFHVLEVMTRRVTET
jgi:hypothetical protein